MTSARHIHVRAQMLAPLLVAVGIACTGPATGEPAGAASDGTNSGDSGTMCIAARTRPGGGCCATGTFYDASTDTCAPVGPPSCAAGGLDAIADCVPRWCWNAQNDRGGACDPATDPSCPLIGRPCTADELAADAGCPAGMWPAADGNCIPAGLSSDATSGVDGAPPPLRAPPGVPPLTPLPTLLNTRFCADPATGDAHVCADGQSACPPGQMPGASPPHTFIPVGVPWLCPPGFVVDDPAPSDGGLPTCKPDPADCGTDPFGGVQQAADHVFVDASAPPGGNGTRAKPFASLQSAKIIPGGILAIAAGTYTVSIAFPVGLHMQGRCAHLVKLVAPPNKYTVVANGKTGDEMRLTGVTLTGAGIGLLAITPVPVVLERVFISGNSVGPLSAQGATTNLTIVDSVLSGGPPNGEKNSPGASISGGAHVTLKRVRATRFQATALGTINAGTLLVASELLVDETTHALQTMQTGYGVSVRDGSRAELTSVRLSRNTTAALRIEGAGATLLARAVIADHTRPRGLDGTGGFGLLVVSGAAAHVHGVRLSANSSAGATVLEPATKLIARGLIVDGTQPDKSASEQGAGLQILSGASGDVGSIRLSANTASGLVVHLPGSSLSARDVLVDATLPTKETYDAGIGINVTDGAALDLLRARVTDCVNTGVLVGSQAATLRARELLVDHIAAGASGHGGHAVSAAEGGRIDLVGVRLHRNLQAALAVAGPTSIVRARGLLIDQTSAAPEVAAGHGATCQTGGTIAVAGGRIHRSIEAGASAYEGATLTLAGVVIERTQAEPKAGLFGAGLAINGKATSLNLVGCRVVNNTVAAAYLVKGNVAVAGSVFARTAVGTAVRNGEAFVFADGLIGSSLASLTVADSAFVDQQRAAIHLVGDGSATVTRTIAGIGHYGIATEGSGTLDAAHNLLVGNQQNRVGDQKLQLPAPPAAVLIDVGK